MMRWARPSTIAVLPTPGSPISTGLFLVRRCSTWMVRRISSSRPITGSSLPLSARAVRSMVYFSSAWRCFLGVLVLHLLAAAHLVDRRFELLPCRRRRPSAPCPASPLSSSAASTNSSLAMNASPRCCASLSVTLSRRERSLPTETLPSWPETFGSLSSASARRSRSTGTLTPAWASNGRVPPPDWSSSASSRCAGSIRLWSRPTASDCASASACWKREVSLSMRMESSEAGWPACPGNAIKMRLQPGGFKTA